jgi:NAD(P)-dependent dehydrogenase (short-subunit alcohol dehydrogenase family)
MNAEVVLITGCSSGIGRALALEFQKAGCSVVATARVPATIDDLKSRGMMTLELDITDDAQCRSVVDSVLRATNRIDILVNNAGYGIFGPVIDLPEEELSRQLETNLFGPLKMVTHVAPAMRAAGRGLIVNIGSVSGVVTTPFAGGYCASKSALHALSDALRMELAPFGIRVVTVQPGAVESRFGKTGAAHASRLLRSDFWYSPVREAIRARAEISQVGATPAEQFASRIVRRLLQGRPPALIRGGKLSLLLPLMKAVLPSRALDTIFARKFGLASLATSRR